MKKYIIRYNNGFGDVYDITCAKNETEAQDHAYEAARSDWENSVADYDAEEYTDEKAEEYGI